MIKILSSYICLLLTIFVTACTSPSDPRYRVATVGNAQRVIEVIVISVESVIIKKAASGTGSTSGGILGLAAGAESSDNAVVIVGATIFGAIVGNAIEDNLSQTNGRQYVVRTSTDALLTVTQADIGNHIFHKGNQALLIHGFPSRIIKGH